MPLVDEEDMPLTPLRNGTKVIIGSYMFVDENFDSEKPFYIVTDPLKIQKIKKMFRKQIRSIRRRYGSTPPKGLRIGVDIFPYSQKNCILIIEAAK